MVNRHVQKAKPQIRTISLARAIVPVGWQPSKRDGHAQELRQHEGGDLTLILAAK